uniref:Uncharacterized protein n=1 Tax=Arundo donax TaxID=35708 RepID=A0A0A8Z932_ARUDO
MYSPLSVLAIKITYKWIIL